MSNANRRDHISARLLALANGRRQVRVTLADLRRSVALTREDLDEALILGQRAGLWVLYREDRTSALTQEDHAAAIMVGGHPRHLVLLDR